MAPAGRLLLVTDARRCLLLLLSFWLLGCETEIRSDGMPTGLAAATYSGIYAEPVALADGRYQGPPFIPDGASRPQVTLLSAPWLQADLEGDGSVEYVVLLAESSGGSGTFIYMAVMKEAADGFHNVATTLLGDRVEVKSLWFENRQLSVLLEERLATPPPQQRNWRFENASLQEIVELAGQLTLGHEVRQFVSCGGDDALWVLDSTGGELRSRIESFALEPYQPLFVVVRGVVSAAPEAEFAKDYSQQLQILQLLRAEREGWGCRLELGDARYRALGVEPFWRVDVMQDTLVFATPDTDTREFQRLDSTDQAVTFEGVDAAGGRLQLRLQNQPCTDPMSGSLYQFSAQLELDETQLNGCAVTPLPGR